MLLSGIKLLKVLYIKSFRIKRQIYEIFPEDKYERFDKNFQMNTIAKKAYNPDTKTWNDQYFITETQKFLSKEEAEKLLKKLKAGRALKNKDIALYEKLTLEVYQDYSKAGSNELILSMEFF
jgi:hypothetical protein